MVKTTINKINLLLLLTLCLGYASTLYGVQNDVDDEKDNDAYALKQQETRIIKRSTSDFEALLKKGRPPGGSSLDIQYFKHKKTGKTWIGKCSKETFIMRKNYEEYREALGLTMYRFFGIITPDFAVSVQPVAPSVCIIFPPGDIVPVGNKNYRIDANSSCMHIMTQFLDGFSTCKEAFPEAKQDAKAEYQDAPFMRAYKQAAKAKQPFHLAKNGKKYLLQGLGSMLAVANFIYDMDCIGKSGGNLGYRIQGNYAQVVKIDPGYAFGFLEDIDNKKFDHNPMDRKTFFGTDESATLGYSQLTLVDQKAFAAMAKRILKIPRKTLKQLIYSVVVPGGWQKKMADKLLDHLIARKSLFLAAFALEIDDNLRQEITEAKHRLVGSLIHQKDNQKQSKAQIEAYQKALAAVRAWEAKVAANRLIKQKEHQNNQAPKPVVGEIFQLPSREGGDFFTGRQQERAAMAAFFGTKRKKSCAFQAITGVGGMGKTLLALHYAHACAAGAGWVPHRYNAILWFYAEAGLDSQFHELAKVWRKKDCKTAQEAVKFVYKALQKKKRTLLIFDNAEQSKDVAPYLPPRRQKGTIDILLTTRNPALNFVHYGKPTYITLGAFSKEEGRVYIQKILGHKGHSKQAMDALWETVSGLPLALNHALQYIAKGKCTLEKYPARFAEHQLRLGAQLQASPVVTSVLLSVLTLREAHPLIEPLLVTAAYLAPDNIPKGAVFAMVGAKKDKKKAKKQAVSLLQKFGLFKQKEGNQTKIIPQHKQQALTVLHKYGLLTLAPDGDTFDFHRLVQQVLREWHRSKKGKAGHEALLKSWMAYFDKNLEYDERDLDAIYQITPLIPHAYAIADADSNAAAIQKAQAALYGQIGRHQCFGVGHYDRAKQCYQKALKIDEKHYGADHPSTASTMMNLGNVLTNLGDYAQAKQCFQKALKIKEKHYGADHPTTAMTINNLGEVLRNLGNYALAKTYFQKALKIEEKHYGADHPSTASTMMNLGNVLFHLGDYAQAKQCYEKALKIEEKHYGADHPSTARTINNLGEVLRNLGNYALAKTYFQKALKIEEKHYGADHPQTSKTIECLGNVLRNLGDYAQAKQCYEKALKINTQHYGADHSETARTIENLGTVLDDLGDYTAAKQYYEKALRLHEKHYGVDHPSTASTMMNLGNVLFHLGDYAQAKQCYEKALKIEEKHYGADHPETAATMENLGNVLQDLGDYAQAKQYLEKALKINEKHYGADHPETAGTMMNLGTVLSKQGDYAKAKQCYEKALKIFKPHYGADHPETVSTIQNLGMVLADLGDYAEAKQCFQKALKIEEKHYEIGHIETASTINNLGEALRNLGDYAQAKTYLQKALKIKEKHYGADHPTTARTIANLGNVLDDLGDYAEAKQCYEKALRLHEKHYGADHPETARTIANLGTVLRNLGDYAEAKQCFQKALKIEEKHYGADHPTTAGTIENLGVALLYLGEYAEAKTYFQKTFKVKEQHYGADHTQTAITMVNLGVVFDDLGNYVSAKKDFEQALKVFKQHYGATHPSTAIAMVYMGRVLRNLGAYESAKEYLEKALKIEEGHYGADHPEIAKAVHNLGNVLINLGDYLSAKNYLEKALKIRKQHYGADHVHTARTMGILGILFEKLGQYAKAREYYQQNIKVFTRHYGPNHSETKRVKRNLARLEEEVAAKSKQKQPKAPKIAKAKQQEVALNLVTGKPNKEYTVHERPKELSSDDEKENDVEDNEHIVLQQQPKNPKIDKAKQQEIALIQATWHFVAAMKGQLAKTPVPAYLGSKKWDANAAPTFVAEVLRMYRKQQYLDALLSPESYSIPAPLAPFIKAYVRKYPKLQQVAQRPDFCKSHLEKLLMLGQIDQLRAQFLPNAAKKDNDKAAKVNELIKELPLLKTHQDRAEALYIKLKSADTPQKKLQLTRLQVEKLSANRTPKEKFASWISSKADKLNHIWIEVDNEDYLPLLYKLNKALLKQIAAEKEPKAALENPLKNNDENPNDDEVFDID